jgi:hypothetical protein
MLNMPSVIFSTTTTFVEIPTYVATFVEIPTNVATFVEILTNVVVVEYLV